MTENNIRHLPVVDQNHKLINFLSQRDLILSPTKKINQILMIGILSSHSHYRVYNNKINYDKKHKRHFISCRTRN